MVGARALHELIEVVQKALLGLLASVTSSGDQRGVGRSATIFFVLFAPLRGGALVLILALGLAFVPASVEDRSDHLLAEGVVRGDIEQVTGGTRLQAAKLVDQVVLERNALMTSTSTTSGRELHLLENLRM